MKFLKEYRDPELVSKLLDAIHRLTSQRWSIMEICGGQTHSLVRNGIIDLLPKEITMIHGPGCPVCVTPVKLIDKAIAIANQPKVTLCSFGDMLRVPGTKESLLKAKAKGADIRILYSPLQAVELARENPSQQVVFFAVGFETTAPANALSVIHAHKLGLANYSILTSHVLVPPAMEAILTDPDQRVNGFLAAGHVCTVMGLSQYRPIAENYKVPIVATGFEPVDLLHGILMTIKQLERGEYKVNNQYSRVIRDEGNLRAQSAIEQVFRVADMEWRGLGAIPNSGLAMRPRYAEFDAHLKFDLGEIVSHESRDCIAGDVLKGIKKPKQCPAFGKTCTPVHPLGAPMVSSEGACAAYYQYHQETLTEKV